MLIRLVSFRFAFLTRLKIGKFPEQFHQIGGQNDQKIRPIMTGSIQFQFRRLEFLTHFHDTKFSDQFPEIGDETISSQFQFSSQFDPKWINQHENGSGMDPAHGSHLPLVETIWILRAEEIPTEISEPYNTKKTGHKPANNERCASLAHCSARKPGVNSFVKYKSISIHNNESAWLRQRRERSRRAKRGNESQAYWPLQLLPPPSSSRYVKEMGPTMADRIAEEESSWPLGITIPPHPPSQPVETITTK